MFPLAALGLLAADPLVTLPAAGPVPFPGNVYAVAPDGRWVATNPYSYATEVQFWDVRTGGLLSTARIDRARLYERAVPSPDGRTLAVWAMRGKDWDKDWGALLIDTATGRVTELPFEVGYPHGLTADGSGLYAGRRFQRTAEEAPITLWSLPDAKPVRTFTVPACRWLYLAPDGKTAHLRAERGGHEVWDFSTGKRLSVLTAEGPETNYPQDFVGFADGGKKVVTAFGGHTPWVFDAATGKRERVLALPRAAREPAPHVRGIADDLSVVAAATHGGEVRVLEPGKDRPRAVIVAAPPGEFVYGYPTLTPDGKRVLRTHPVHGVEVFDAATGRRLLALRPATQQVRAVAFAADGRTLVAGTGNRPGYRVTGDQSDPPAGHLLVWDAATGQLRKGVVGVDPEVCGVHPSADGAKAVAVAGKARPDYYGWGPQRAVLWDLAAGKELRTLAGPKGDFYGFTASADGRRLAAVVTETREVDDRPTVVSAGARVWDLPTGDRAGQVAAAPDAYRLSFTPDGDRLLAYGQKSGVESWGVAGGKPAGLWKPAPTVNDTRPPLLPLALPRGDEFAALCGRGPNLSGVYWYAAGRQIRFGKVPVMPGPLAVSADGKWVAAGEQPHVGPADVLVWKLPDPPPLDEATIKGGVIPPEEFPVEPVVLRGHVGPVHALAFSPDGKALATGGADGAARVWDVRSGRLRATLWVAPAAAPGAAPTDWVAFTPAGRYVGSPRGLAFLRVSDAVSALGFRVPVGAPRAATADDPLHDPAAVRAALGGK